jgi:hypothetical protein
MLIAIAILTVILQTGFLVHLFKSGRPYWWGFIILSFPVIGCIVYYFIEIFPDTQEARKAEKIVHTIGKRMGGDKAFMRRVEEVEICGSVDNKLALARECMERGIYDDAARLFHNCMQGLFADDPNLLLGLSTTLVEKQDFSEARVRLDRLQAKHPDFKPNDARLLRARVLEGLGDTQGALRVYEPLLPVYVGFEARYRHGLLLQKLGHAEQSRSAFETMLDHARRHHVSHGEEQAWLDRAKQELKA